MLGLEDQKVLSSRKTSKLWIKLGLFISKAEKQGPMLKSSAGVLQNESMAQLKMSLTAVVFFPLAHKGMARSIYAYNHLRPHASCDYLTPAQAHYTQGIFNKRWPINSTKKVVFTNVN